MSEYATFRRMSDLMGRPTSSAWREEALARAAEMYTVLHWMQDLADQDESKRHLAEAVEAHLDAARQGAHTRGWWWRTWTGAAQERTMANLDAAEIGLLRLAPTNYLRSFMPNAIVKARQYLDVDDPRLTTLVDLDEKFRQGSPDEFDRYSLVAALQGAVEQGRREDGRIRNFRNVILVTATMLAVLAIAVRTLGWFQPTLIPLCFEPIGAVVCPTAEVPLEVPLSTGQTNGQGETAAANTRAVNDAIDEATSPWDVALVEFVGLLGATIAAASTLRRMRSTTDPYSLPAALAILKVCTGALTALLGLLLIRAQFVPGFSALDSTEQIIAWAIVLGYAQQIFTRAVDAQAETVLTRTKAVISPPPRGTPQTTVQAGAPETTAQAGAPEPTAQAQITRGS